jgi:hypothetical protein
MTQRSRSLTDWLLLRAWIEPDHAQKLRVVVRSPAHENEEDEEQQAFADAEGAAAFVRTWLHNLVRRWEGGERYRHERRWGEPEDGDGADTAPPEPGDEDES